MNTEKKLDRDAIMVSFDLLSDRLRQRDADVLEIIVVVDHSLRCTGFVTQQLMWIR
jgi:hypothetical protein